MFSAFSFFREEYKILVDREVFLHRSSFVFLLLWEACLSPDRSSSCKLRLGALPRLYANITFGV